MTLRHPRILSGTLAVGGTLALAACGLGSESEDSADTSGEIEGTIQFQTMQLSPTFDDYINGVIADFEEANPGTTVEWTDIPSDAAARKVSADAVAGTLPDVMDLDTATLAPLGRDGQVLDMAEVAPELQEDFVASAWASFDFGATTVAALPWYLNTPVLYANTTLLEEAGLADAPAPTGYEELFERSETIAAQTGKAGFQPTAVGLPHALLTMGVPLVNDDATAAVVNTPEAVAFLERLAELYASGGIPADTVTAKQRSEIETFQEGEIAYLESGPSRVAIIEENAPDLIPSVAIQKPLGDTSQTTWIVAHGIAVPTTSENQATALAFAEFLTSPESQLDFAKQSSIFPSTAESLEDPFFTAEPTDLTTEARATAGASLLEDKTLAKPAAVDSEFSTALWSHAQPAILGEVSAEQALADAEAELTAMLEARSE
ncbi:ABC transporter substrate-binding protein [Phytoactinopolyspora halotolerans]|uniref:Sugar ABC transporter substrate-binding protein n=1 Tax=Phytoactinopolyspora halotolerans TaxID=1981512 RepID=A0A6L9S6X8_9ACTN|nr:sugar ABC transporter substrate-binding protein [Phytoactinopolyspora halotolerans]NEE00414.1 sugar ABC transporter substrate-binding protein [Phytoactinopolyspora halotolerans]